MEIATPATQARNDKTWARKREIASGLKDKPLAMTRVWFVIARRNGFCPDMAISGTWEPHKREWGTKKERLPRTTSWRSQ